MIVPLVPSAEYTLPACLPPAMTTEGAFTSRHNKASNTMDTLATPRVRAPGRRWQRDVLLSRDRSGAAAQHELLDFAGRRLWQCRNWVPDLRRLEMGHAFADERSQFLVRCRHPGAENDEGMWRLAPALVGHADNRCLEDGRVAQEHRFHLHGGYVLAPADDHVLDAVADFHVAVRVYDSGVAGMEPPVSHAGLRGLGIAVVARHDSVTTHHDLAE